MAIRNKQLLNDQINNLKTTKEFFLSLSDRDKRAFAFLIAASLTQVPLCVVSCSNVGEITEIEQDGSDLDCFNDVDIDSDEYDSIYKAAYIDAIIGDENGSIKPYEIIGSKEFVTNITRVLMFEEPKKMEKKEEANKIVTNIEGLTKEGAAVIVGEVVSQFRLELPFEYSPKRVKDISNVSSRAVNSVMGVVNLGIMKTDCNDEFKPNDKVTRAESIDIAVRLTEFITGEKMYMPKVRESKDSVIKSKVKRSNEIDNLKKSKRVILSINKILNKKM